MPAIVAHRGDSAHHPENTLAAFAAAADAGADVVEFDVRRSRDGNLVVIHDPKIAPGSIAPVAELTLAQIKALEPEIPTLDEALELLRGRVALEVEIKNVPGEPGFEPAGKTIARDVVSALRRHAFTDAFVASFDAESLKSVRELDSGRDTGLLVDPSANLDEVLESVADSHSILLPEARALETAGRSFIDRVHERGIRLCAWIVDDAASIGRLFELGVDAVETNDPALGVVVRDRVRSPRRVGTGRLAPGS